VNGSVSRNDNHNVNVIVNRSVVSGQAVRSPQ
jgi:hypothetical protein